MTNGVNQRVLLWFGCIKRGTSIIWLEEIRDDKWCESKSGAMVWMHEKRDKHNMARRVLMREGSEGMCEVYRLGWMNGLIKGGIG